MIKTSRQLKDLINNLARKNAADAQLLMRNYVNGTMGTIIDISKERGDATCIQVLTDKGKKVDVLDWDWWQQDYTVLIRMTVFFLLLMSRFMVMSVL